MHQFAKFAKTTLYRGYFQNHHQLCPSFLTFFEKICLSTADYRKNTPKRSHPFRKKSEKNCLLTSVYHFFTIEMLQLFRIFSKNFHLLPGLYPKRHPFVLPLSEKNLKNITPTPLTISFSPPKCCTFFKKIEKFLYPHLPYHRLGAVFAPFSPKKQSARRRLAFPPLPRLFPKRYPFVLPFSEKIRKKHHLYTGYYQDYPPVL